MRYQRSRNRRLTELANVALLADPAERGWARQSYEAGTINTEGKSREALMWVSGAGEVLTRWNGDVKTPDDVFIAFLLGDIKGWTLDLPCSKKMFCGFQRIARKASFKCLSRVTINRGAPWLTRFARIGSWPTRIPSLSEARGRNVRGFDANAGGGMPWLWAWTQDTKARQALIDGRVNELPELSPDSPWDILPRALVKAIAMGIIQVLPEPSRYKPNDGQPGLIVLPREEQVPLFRGYCHWVGPLIPRHAWQEPKGGGQWLDPQWLAQELAVPTSRRTGKGFDTNLTSLTDLLQELAEVWPAAAVMLGGRYIPLEKLTPVTKENWAYGARGDRSFLVSMITSGPRPGRRLARKLKSALDETGMGPVTVIDRKDEYGYYRDERGIKWAARLFKRLDPVRSRALRWHIWHELTWGHYMTVHMYRSMGRVPSADSSDGKALSKQPVFEVLAGISGPPDAPSYEELLAYRKVAFPGAHNRFTRWREQNEEAAAA